MKQGRQEAGGARRQEVAKTWRRNEPGSGKPAQVAARHQEDAEGDETPREDPPFALGEQRRHLRVRERL
jgi:hypothetical protein